MVRLPLAVDPSLKFSPLNVAPAVSPITVGDVQPVFTEPYP